ncbi:5'-nucleotidase C-terminal domain-containing protein [Flavobacterium sp.]|uniref:5'-nucleotidase C-terminal domain-containing protein n=1 Tax=Flavobacterium sp. TaxID=239 RepID=UPI0035272F5A
MVKIEKNTTITVYFVFLLTLFFSYGCHTPKTVYEVTANQYTINEKLTATESIEKFVAPYREHINQEMDSVLCYNAVAQDKSIGKWETNIGNLFAQATFQFASPIFQSKFNKKIDACLLNHGGIRAVIPKGNVTVRTAYEIMPFENSVVVVGLTGKEITDLATYYLAEKKPHPLYGITIYTDENAEAITKIMIDTTEVEPHKIYYIATSDYLANGGDSMTFFKDSTIKYDLDYKLRNLFIDYFKSVNALPNLTTQHIITN